MGCLLGGPREADLDPEAWQDHQRELADCWVQWRSVVASLLVTTLVEEDARKELESRYLGGRPALLAATAEVWDAFADQVDRLWSIAEARPESGSMPKSDARAHDLLGARIADRVGHLADDARVSTFERVGEQARAIAIVERRLTGRSAA